jgi:hypothetical protein
MEEDRMRFLPPWLLDLSFHLRFAGLTLIFLGVAHAFFGPRFKWREEMARLSLLNAQMFYVHTFYVAFTVTLMGILCLFGTRGLTERTFLGQWLCAGLALFWGTRLVFQFFVYSRDHWRGKRFETAVHLLFACAWTYYSAVFSWAWWGQTVAP